MSRVLVTTAIEETWPDGEPVLFLGEWCRRFSRRKRWSGLNAEVVKYHWDNRERLSDDFRYLGELHERLLEDLVSDLNELHGTDHSLRYWRILVGPWLGHFVAMLRDRWLSVEEAVGNHDISWTYVLNLRESGLVPRTYSDFASLYVRDEWNHYIYSMVLEKFTQVELRQQAQRDYYEPVRTVIRPGNMIKVKTWMWETLSRFLARFIREDDVVLFGTYLSFRKEMALHLRLRQVPLIWHLVPFPDLELEVPNLYWAMSGNATDPFEQLVKELIPRQIPSAYSGGYCNLQAVAEESQLPTKPRLIFSSNSESTNDLFKVWVASKVENGARLVLGQHGGGYGVFRQYFYEDHQRKISDMFLSWGWEDPADRRVRPVGQLAGNKPSSEGQTEQKTTLLVGYATPRQSYHLYSHPIASQWLAWLEDQFKFVAALPEDIRSTLLVRLYRQNYGWDQVERWHDRYPDIPLDDAQGPKTLVDLLPQTRVLIATYNATTYLESFAMNVPTIMFWNPDHWELRETAVPFFDNLVEAGVLHHSPASAAAKLTEVWDDVDTWWSSESVTAAKERFCERYNRSPHNLVNLAAEALRATIEAPPRSS